MPLFLVADVGGTNTRFALSDGPHLRSESIERRANDDFASFTDAMHDYLAGADVRPDGVAVAIAGPVAGDHGRLTNRAWHFSTRDLAAASGAGNAAIFNDLQAQGLGLPDPGSDSLTSLRAGRIDDTAARLVINVGTGLNIATVWQTAHGPFVAAAEAGHITLPVRDETQMKIAAHLADKHGFSAAEEVLSGRGLAALHKDLSGQETSAAEVSRRAAEGDAAARATVALFCRFLGQYAGDLALVQLAFGGVYLVGGVARSLAEFIAGADYSEGFVDKGRFGPFLDPIPTYLVTDDYAPLRGLARHLAGHPDA